LTDDTKTKKTLKKAVEIEKVKATAKAQSHIDEVIHELKLSHPVCAEHRTHCWTGHQSGEHVSVTEMWFRHWATKYVSAFSTCLFDSFNFITARASKIARKSM
jgi:hypothetical protein